MKTFKQFMYEDFRARLVPAIEDSETGKVHKGKRTETHDDLAKRKNLNIKGRLGFWDTGKHKFYPKHGPDGLNMDSTDLDPSRRPDPFGDTTDHMSDFRRTREMLKHA